ncbi:MAG: 16S rRNA (cytosine(1402)-N(4))-methyltransferase RsmH, partial [Candidatus Omnitrophota bacterium]
MLNELTEYLKLQEGQTILDCTVGCGGHAEAVLKAIGDSGRFIGVDQDKEALKVARDRLSNFPNSTLIHANFRNIETVAAGAGLDKVNGIIFDVGVSSLHLNSPERGFSIRHDGPLDMRMDKEMKRSAFDLVNFMPEPDLDEIFKKYGEERWHRRIARAIVWERQKTRITTTAQLSALVARVVPCRYGRIHPATRTFQALRIAVNDELEALREALIKCVDLVFPGGRICVISFHSLEDRIVKEQFRNLSREGKLQLITKKPLVPSDQEIARNPRARSAKLRVGEKMDFSEN